jgi:AcrR family transcriptional regulator
VEAEKPRRGRPPEGVRTRILEATLELIGGEGIARLTTKEIAARAGASEASIYYHFADKTALLEGVVVEAVLEPLRTFAASFGERVAGKPVREALLDYGRALERFWRRVLPVLSAIQSDVELRDGFRDRIGELGLGPHRGVRVLRDYLREQQRAGKVRPDVDVQGAALSFAGACFLSAYQGHMLGPAARRKLPALEAAIDALAALLEPAAAHGAAQGTKR